MLLDPETLEFVPRAQAVVALSQGDPHIKLELPASQIELITTPRRTLPEAAAELAAMRRALAGWTTGMVRLGAAGVHPFRRGAGELNRLERYEHTIREYGSIASRQLVCAFQVHVSVPGADRAPAPRGPISEQLLCAFAGRPGALGTIKPGTPADPLADEDLHLSLYARAARAAVRACPARRGPVDGREDRPG